MIADLDLSMLLHAFDGNHTNVSLVLSAALAAIDKDVSSIERAAATGDIKHLAEAAHRVKGTSGTIRAGRLFEIVMALELAARTPPGRVNEARILEMREATVALRAEIAAYDARSRR